ncbi:MAG TPA: hypothetical protein VJH92_04055 [Candidatus Nanoarchaeia archaeon]|nr:hypothetical protein [Candidatus Nanoarchaeia archaeon]
MKIKLIPKENFDKKSIETITKLVGIAENLLKSLDVDVPDSIEFYDELDPFIKRILSQVEGYGLTSKQAREFIKASLNSGTYGTFDIKDNTIIEMNFNPYLSLEFS